MDYLSCPNPHYIPGYTGFCPQLQYRVGDSYAKATYKLLLDPTVCHAEKLVLSDREAHDYHLYLPDQKSKKKTKTGKQTPAQPGDEGFDVSYASEFFKTVDNLDCGICDMSFYNQLRKKWNTCPSPNVNPRSCLIDPRIIYHKNIGQLPNYTGHIPGLPFRIGKPYGNDTIDSKRWLRGDYSN